MKCSNLISSAPLPDVIVALRSLLFVGAFLGVKSAHRSSTRLVSSMSRYFCRAALKELPTCLAQVSKACNQGQEPLYLCLQCNCWPKTLKIRVIATEIHLQANDKCVICHSKLTRLLFLLFCSFETYSVPCRCVKPFNLPACEDARHCVAESEGYLVRHSSDL